MTHLEFSRFFFFCFLASLFIRLFVFADRVSGRYELLPGSSQWGSGSFEWGKRGVVCGGPADGCGVGGSGCAQGGSCVASARHSTTQVDHHAFAERKHQRNKINIVTNRRPPPHLLGQERKKSRKEGARAREEAHS